MILRPVTRLSHIDSLRGFAIVSMVAANAGAEVLAHPHSFGFRLFGSFAAPIFVALAGMMVALATARDRSRTGPRHHGLRYYLNRGAFLLLIAITADLLIGQYLPLITCDVLYLIALSLPLCHLAARLRPRERWGSVLAMFLATPWLQWIFGYRASISQPSLSTPLSEWVDLLPEAAQRFLLDGWFPVFPWVGFALLGAAVGAGIEDDRKRVELPPRLAAGVLALGIFTWWLAPGPLAERNGYTELFYPPNLGFLLTASGVFLCLMILFERFVESRIMRFLRPLGRCSLFLYIVHLFLIHRIWMPFVDDMPLGQFLGIYIVLLVLLQFLAAGVDVIKKLCRETGLILPAPLAMLLGG